jgi:hypothetical protein
MTDRLYLKQGNEGKKKERFISGMMMDFLIYKKEVTEGSWLKHGPR